MQQNQPSPDEQRNLILAAVLSLGVILLWQVFYVNPNLERQRLAEEARQQAIAEAQAEGRDVDPVTGLTPAPTGASATATAERPFAGPIINREAALAESARVQIRTPSVTGSIALTGGLFDELKLNKYREELDPESADVELLWPVRTEQAYYAAFGWHSSGAAVETPTDRSIWAVAPGSADTLTPEQPVTLVYDNGAGLVFTRRIEVDDRYMFTVTQSVENRGTAPVNLQPHSRVERRGQLREGIWILHEGPIGVFDGALHELDYSDITDAPIVDIGKNIRRVSFNVSDSGWIGYTEKYWMAALAPVGAQTYVAAFDVSPGPQGRPVHEARIGYASKRIAPGETLSVTTRLFAGAKEKSALRDYQYLLDGLERPTSTLGRISDFFFYAGDSRFTDAIDWGWFPFLTRPIAEILAALNNASGNMGVAIILLTLLFKLMLFPLAQKAFVSMSKLKKLQPDMQLIQEKHKEDRMAMQQEMMALYKKEKVNPAAGCLPILLQIPIFFSLYKVLFVTLEIRHAPFFGWIQDLSAPDPTSILNLFGLMPWDGLSGAGILGIFAIGVWPVLMGITMWIQQMLNPAPTDPIQAQVFAILPLLFTFMLGSFASGLVIYWTANNLFTLAQQYAIMRSQGVDVDILGNMKRQLGLAPKESGG
ncbi:MAG: membrane protein insertase YidC [Pseudomonadota bacterium]